VQEKLLLAKFELPILLARLKELVWEVHLSQALLQLQWYHLIILEQ
jgi:hypothetical protein